MPELDPGDVGEVEEAVDGDRLDPVVVDVEVREAGEQRALLQPPDGVVGGVQCAQAEGIIIIIIIIIVIIIIT